LINDDLDLFLHTITEDEILATMGEDLSEEDKFMHVYRQEVMRTVIDGRYSGACYLNDWCVVIVASGSLSFYLQLRANLVRCEDRTHNLGGERRLL
jgi:hypothetical protein